MNRTKLSELGSHLRVRLIWVVFAILIVIIGSAAAVWAQESATARSAVVECLNIAAEGSSDTRTVTSTWRASNRGDKPLGIRMSYSVYRDYSLLGQLTANWQVPARSSVVTTANGAFLGLEERDLEGLTFLDYRALLTIDAGLFDYTRAFAANTNGAITPTRGCSGLYFDMQES